MDAKTLGTHKYWENQCRIQREQLTAAKTVLALHVARVDKLREKLHRYETYKRNASKEKQT